jgi:hypothetical protein
MTVTICAQTQNGEIVKEITVENLFPILGNPLTLAAFLIYRDLAGTIDEDWIINGANMIDDSKEVKPLYEHNHDDTSVLTFGDILASATSDDFADLNVISKVRITESIIAGI